MQVVLAARLVELPGGAGEAERQLFGSRGRRRGRAPPVPVALRAVRRRARLDEPRVLVGGVVDDEVHHELHAARVDRGEQRVEVGERAEHRVDVLVVGDVVAVVVLRRGVDRRQPDHVDAERGEVVEVRGDARAGRRSRRRWSRRTSAGRSGRRRRTSTRPAAGAWRARLVSARVLLAHPDYTRERVRQVARASARSSTPTARPTAMRIAGPVDRIPAAAAAALDYRDAELGMALGPLWATWWLRGGGGRARGRGRASRSTSCWSPTPRRRCGSTASRSQGLVSGGAYVRDDAMLTRARGGGRAARGRGSRSPATGSSDGPSCNPQPHEAAASARAVPRSSAASSRASTARPGRSPATSTCWRR